MTLACEHCGSPFHPEYGREMTSRFCSVSCCREARFGKTPPNRCRECDADISNTGKRAQKFCSFECRVKAQTGRTRRRRIIRYGKGGAYRARLTPEHPNADSKGYVMEHHLIMEGHIGRVVATGEVVHHEDGEPSNNNIENLRLMLKRDHDSLHSLERWRDGRMGRRSVKVF